MKRYYYICFVFLIAFNAKSQLLFYQDTYKGGVTADGVSYCGYDYLQADSINFQLHIPITATIRKAYLLNLRYIYIQGGTTPFKDSPMPVYFNSTLLTFDSSTVLTNTYYDTYSNPADPTWISGIDVTHLVQTSNNKLIRPSQIILMNNDPSRDYVYGGFILVVMYNEPTMTSTNSVIFLNNVTQNTIIMARLAGLNPIDNAKDVTLSLWTENVTSQVVGYTLLFALNSSLGNFNLGILDQYNHHGNCYKSLPGSFYYENNILTGLVDDINSPFIDSTDAISNIKTYVVNGTTSFSLTSTGKDNGVDYRNGYVLAYTTPCPARSNKDTTMSYSICSGTNSVQLAVSSNTTNSTYSWYSANGDVNSATTASVIVTPTVTTTYIALIDSNGCKHTEHFKVNVYTSPKTDSVKTTIGICGSTAGTATIIASVGSPTSYTVNGMVQSSPNYTNLAAGSYTFALSNNFGCTYTSPKAFIIKDTNLAKARFVVTPDSGCAPLTINCTNYSNYTGNLYSPVTNAYTWYVNGDSATTTNFNYTFTDTGKYVITLFAYETLRKCSATTTQTITVKDCPPDSIHITVPNIFSPNADGINDSWQIAVSSYQYTVNSYSCVIYDRWGIQVFETSNISEVWSGKTTSGLPCSAGTYFYIIKLTATNSKGKTEDKDFKGYLELVR
jgi:gliding motility-associated-like protein